jgi:hypothetical protein
VTKVDYILISKEDLAVYQDYIMNKDAKPNTKAGKLAKEALVYLTENCESGYYRLNQRSRAFSNFIDVRNIGRVSGYTVREFFQDTIVQLKNRIPQQYVAEFAQLLTEINDLIPAYEEALQITKDAYAHAKANDGEMLDVELTDRVKLANIHTLMIKAMTAYPVFSSAINGYVKY